MDRRTSVLCAVDYSAASRTALRYAATAAESLDGPLAVLTVNDPLLAETLTAVGRRDWVEVEAVDLRRFCQETLDGRGDARTQIDVRVGNPAEQILAVAAQRQVALIVIGSHGLTGIRKMVFGSTAERVLRDTTVPVLVTPSDMHAPSGIHELATLTRRIVVAVDLGERSVPLATIGAALGRRIGVPVIVVHAIEPLMLRPRWRGQVPSLQAEARTRAQAALDVIAAHAGVIESIIVFGEPADEVGELAEIRGAGLVVMGLQERGAGRVGVVAYRILSRTHVPILAIPAASDPDLGCLQELKEVHHVSSRTR